MKNYDNKRTRKSVNYEELEPCQFEEKQTKKKVLSKQEELQRYGNYPLNFHAMANGFDPFRLQIIMLKKEDANLYGKNPDYQFIQGLDHLLAKDPEHAIKDFAKGVSDNSTHFLCRFMLGYALFKVGHFQEAAQQYDTLMHQCKNLGLHSNLKLIQTLYNKAVCELQSALFGQAADSAAGCLRLIKKQMEETSGTFINMPRKNQMLLISTMQIQGIANFRAGDVKEAGELLEGADVRLGMIQQLDIDATSRKAVGLKAKMKPFDAGYSERSEMASVRNEHLKPRLYPSPPSSRNRSAKRKKIKNDPPIVEKIEVTKKLNLDQIEIRNELKNQLSAKQIQDTNYYNNLAYMESFKHRLNVSIEAAADGQDEVQAFRNGKKKQFQYSVETSSRRVSLKKQSNRLVYRNDQRNKESAVLEAEVEKDLTELQHQLRCKRDQKKRKNKDMVIVTLADKERMKDLIQQLQEEQEIAMRNMSFSPMKMSGMIPAASSRMSARSGNNKEFSYSSEIVDELMELITRFREIREFHDHDKRTWLLGNGTVDYLHLQRGEILYEQDVSKADSYYLIISGQVTIVKGITNHQLLYRLKQEKRLRQSIQGQTPRSSNGSEDCYHEDETESQQESLHCVVEQASDSRTSEESVSLSALSAARSPMPLSSDGQANGAVHVSHKYDQFFHQLTKEKSMSHSHLSSMSSMREHNNNTTDKADDPKDAYWLNRQDKRPSDFTYKQMDKQIFDKSKRLRQLERTTTKSKHSIVDSSLNFCKNHVITVDDPPTPPCENIQDRIHVSYTEQNYYQGQLFSNEQYLKWRRMKFKEKMALKINKLLEQKTKIRQYVKELVRERQEAAERDKFPVFKRSAGISQDKSFSHRSPGRKFNSPGKSLSQSNSPNREKYQSKPQLSVKSSPATKQKNIVANLPLMQRLQARFGKGPARLNVKQPAALESLSNLDMSSPMSAGGLSLTASPLSASTPGLHRRGTLHLQSRIDGFGRRQKALEKLKKIRHAEREESVDSQDSQGKNGPYPLADMKRDTTCLVMEDDTLLIRIPYKLERGYIKHLKQLERDAMDV